MEIKQIRTACLIGLVMIILGLTAHGRTETAEVEFHGLVFQTDAEEIDLQDTDAELKEIMELLDRFDRLRHVDMFGTKVDKKAIQQLVKRYPDVTFGWTIHIFGMGKGHDVRTDQTAFSTLHGECYSHSSEQLEVLKYCTELRALDLGHNRVKDLSFLQGLTKMRVLILACNNITDLSPLANMTELEYLEVFSNKVKDLTPLKGLKHLKDLNLVYNKVSGIEELCEMKQLERLWVAHCIKGLKGPLLETLAASLPDTQIVSEGEPTWNGWRDHPRYAVIQKMFEEGTYIPFNDEGSETV